MGKTLWMIIFGIILIILGPILFIISGAQGVYGLVNNLIWYSSLIVPILIGIVLLYIAYRRSK